MAINKATQNRLNGTLDGVTYYEQNGKQIAKISNGISKDQFENDPALARTRENANEFKIVGECSKVLYDMLRPISIYSRDSKFFLRINAVMNELKTKDVVSRRGERNPFNALTNPEGKKLLKGLNFNERGKMESILFVPYSVDSSAGSFSIPGFNPKTNLLSDPSATHYTMKFCKTDINLETNQTELVLSDEFTSEISSAEVDVLLQLNSATTINGLQLFVLQITFSQMVNGEMYPLNNKAYNTSKIIEVL